MRRKSPKFYKRPPLLNAPPLKIEKFNKRPRRLIEVIRYLYRAEIFIPLAKKHKKYKRLELYKHKKLVK